MNEDVFLVENGDFPTCHLGLQGCNCEFCTQYTLQITQTLDISGSVTFGSCIHVCKILCVLDSKKLFVMMSIFMEFEGPAPHQEIADWPCKEVKPPSGSPLVIP